MLLYGTHTVQCILLLDLKVQYVYRCTCIHAQNFPHLLSRTTVMYMYMYMYKLLHTIHTCIIK